MTVWKNNLNAILILCDLHLIIENIFLYAQQERVEQRPESDDRIKNYKIFFFHSQFFILVARQLTSMSCPVPIARLPELEIIQIKCKIFVFLSGVMCNQQLVYSLEKRL